MDVRGVRLFRCRSGAGQLGFREAAPLVDNTHVRQAVCLSWLPGKNAPELRPAEPQAAIPDV
jgi:hypothetical protein